MCMYVSTKPFNAPGGFAKPLECPRGFAKYPHICRKKTNCAYVVRFVSMYKAPHDSVKLLRAPGDFSTTPVFVEKKVYLCVFSPLEPLNTHTHIRTHFFLPSLTCPQISWTTINNSSKKT